MRLRLIVLAVLLAAAAQAQAQGPEALAQLMVQRAVNDSAGEARWGGLRAVGQRRLEI